MLVIEAHICFMAMKLFGMASLDDKPNSPYFPENCTSLPANERWKLLQLAIEDIVNNHIDINFSSPTTEDDDDNVRAYAKELTSLGLLFMEFVDCVREGDGERILRCWRDQSL